MECHLARTAKPFTKLGFRIWRISDPKLTNMSDPLARVTWNFGEVDASVIRNLKWFKLQDFRLLCRNTELKWTKHIYILHSRKHILGQNLWNDHMFIFTHMGSLRRQCSSKCSTTQRCPHPDMEPNETADLKLGPIWVPKTWTTWNRFHLPDIYFWDRWFWASKCNMIHDLLVSSM